jgi:hypothetical protein
MDRRDTTPTTEGLGDRLEHLIGRVEAGSPQALVGLLGTLALTPGVWDSHPVLAMRAERTYLEAFWRIKKRNRERRREHAERGQAVGA